MPLSQTLTRVYPITVTVPAGTSQNAPISVPWVTEDAVLSDVEILIPPGANGVAGIRIMKGDVQLLPWGANSWIIGNDYNRTFPIGGYLPTSDIKIQAYNAGSNQHSFYLRMSVITNDTTPSMQSTSSAGIADLAAPSSSSDPLSPDAILGPDTVAALNDGTITADDIAPVPPPITPPSLADLTPATS